MSLKKQDRELKWPDILESWESLTTVAGQLLKGTSVYLVGDSTEINQIVARELSAGLGYALMLFSKAMYIFMHLEFFQDLFSDCPHMFLRFVTLFQFLLRESTNTCIS